MAQTTRKINLIKSEELKAKSQSLKSHMIEELYITLHHINNNRNAISVKPLFKKLELQHIRIVYSPYSLSLLYHSPLPNIHS